MGTRLVQSWVLKARGHTHLPHLPTDYESSTVVAMGTGGHRQRSPDGEVSDLLLRDLTKLFHLTAGGEDPHFGHALHREREEVV